MMSESRSKIGRAEATRTAGPRESGYEHVVDWDLVQGPSNDRSDRPDDGALAATNGDSASARCALVTSCGASPI